MELIDILRIGIIVSSCGLGLSIGQSCNETRNRQQRYQLTEQILEEIRKQGDPMGDLGRIDYKAAIEMAYIIRNNCVCK